MSSKEYFRHLERKMYSSISLLHLETTMFSHLSYCPEGVVIRARTKVLYCQQQTSRIVDCRRTIQLNKFSHIETLKIPSNDRRLGSILYKQ